MNSDQRSEVPVKKTPKVLTNEQFAEKYGCSRAGYRAKFGYSLTQKRNMLKLGIDPRTNLEEGLAAIKAKRKKEKASMRKEQKRKREEAQVYFRTKGKARKSKHKGRIKGNGGKSGANLVKKGG